MVVVFDKTELIETLTPIIREIVKEEIKKNDRINANKISNEVTKHLKKLNNNGRM